MTEYTIELRTGLGTEVALVGGKGVGLLALTGAGFPVPSGFVVSTDAYRDFIVSAGLEAADPERLLAEIPRADIPAGIAVDILDSLAAMESSTVAVRSSATAEDLAGASFAGQYDSYLSISGEQEVLDAVRDCWASLWTPRSVAYRAQRGVADGELAMAVVVQAMVPAEWAGVLFTADPVSGRRDRIVVEAVPGLGEALVSGTATGQHIEISRPTLSVLAGAGPQPAGAGPQAAVLKELAALGVRAEEHFGGPQDLEWAYADGRCWLLQARPLTAVPEDPTPTEQVSRRRLRRPGRQPGDQGRRRRNRQVEVKPSPFAVTADHMSQPPYPMDLALFIRPAVQAALEAARSAGLRLPPLAEVLVEIDDGVVQIVPPKVRPGLGAVLGVPATVPGLVRLIRTRTDDWRARAEATVLPLARGLDSAELSGLTDRQLLDQVNELFAAVGRLTPSRFAALPAGVAADKLAALLLRPVVGWEQADGLHTELMADVDCVTTRANAELGRLAETVRQDPLLRAAYQQMAPDELAERLAGFDSGRALLRRIDRYLADYGFREVAILTVGQPSLRDRPQIVHGLIKGLAGADPALTPGADRVEHARLELSARPGPVAGALRPLLLKLIDAARTGVAFREDSDYQLAMVPAVSRRLLLELGGRLVRRGVLDEPNDISYLQPAELDGYLEPAEPGAYRKPAKPDRPEQLGGLVQRRKQARAAALDHYTIIPVELLASTEVGQVRGIPASPGSYVGIVRVVRDESGFAGLQPGEVLVCPYTNPVWTPLFALAGAVVVDSGGAASHAAIVAREYGIPAVMGTGNATATLHDGQRVLIDAAQGTVRVVGASAAPTAAVTAVRGSGA